MCPFSQELRILENVGNIELAIIYVDRPFYDLASFLPFRNGGNHSIVMEIFLDDLVDGRSGYADSFFNVADCHSNRSQVSILPEPQLNDFHLHRKLHL